MINPTDGLDLPDDVPVIDFDPDDPEDMAKKLMTAMSDKSLVQNKERPYAGQAHTNTGKRGQQPIEGVTMRDIYDCIILGMVGGCHDPDSDEDPFKHFGKDGLCPIEDCQRPYCKYLRGELEHDDVYALGFSGIDPIAIAQNACVSLRHRMAGTDEREL